MAELRDVLTSYVDEHTPTVLPPFSDVGARLRRRSRRRATALSIGAVVAVAVVGAGVVVSGADTPGTVVAKAPIAAPTTSQSPQTSTGPEPTASPSTRTGPVLDSSSASCVEPYNAQTLSSRGFAFDGTVLSISPVQPAPGRPQGVSGYQGVTLRVNEWFRGGSQATTSVDMMGPTRPAQGVTYGIGTRLLVSGQPQVAGGPLPTPVAFGCGFTRYYDQTTAASWRQLFAH